MIVDKQRIADIFANYTFLNFFRNFGKIRNDVYAFTLRALRRLENPKIVLLRQPIGRQLRRSLLLLDLVFNLIESMLKQRQLFRVLKCFGNELEVV